MIHRKLLHLVFYFDFISLHPKTASCTVWLKLVNWFWKSIFTFLQLSFLGKGYDTSGHLNIFDQKNVFEKFCWILIRGSGEDNKKILQSEGQTDRKRRASDQNCSLDISVQVSWNTDVQINFLLKKSGVYLYKCFKRKSIYKNFKGFLLLMILRVLPSVFSVILGFLL